MYSESTIKTNLNIDVISVIESDKCSRVRILAAAMAPITRIDGWDNSSNPLFEAVKYKCWAQPELRWLPYDQLILELTNWIKTKDVQWRIRMVSCIPVIEKYDNTGLKVCTRMVDAYKTIRENGRYTKIDYKESGEYFAKLNAEKLAKKSGCGKQKFWVIISDADGIYDALLFGDLPDLSIENLQDELGKNISFTPENGDLFILQNKDTEELKGAGIVHFSGKDIDNIDWIYEDVFSNIYLPLIGDEMLKPYLLRNSGRIHSIKETINDQEELRKDMQEC